MLTWEGVANSSVRVKGPATEELVFEKGLGLGWIQPLVVSPVSLVH